METKYNIRRISNIIMALGTIIVAIALVLLVLNSMRGQKEKERLEKQNLQLQTRLEDNPFRKDSSLVMSLVDSLISYTNLKQVDKYVNLFSDTVEGYFLSNNVNKSFIINDVTKYWTRNPNFNYLYRPTESIITRIDSNGIYKVIIYGTHSPDSTQSRNILSELRFNKNKKIIYMRDYYVKK